MTFFCIFSKVWSGACFDKAEVLMIENQRLGDERAWTGF